MSVIRVGSTSRYAEGWDSIFGQGKAPKKAAIGKRSAAKPAAAAKAASKKSGMKKKPGTKKASRAVAKKPVTKARKPGKSRRG